MSTITAVVLTYNEEKHLLDCLTSLAWAPEVLVFDSFSTDRTLEIARAAKARVAQRSFDNYAEQRNAALKAISAEWVLFVDADERATPELAQAVQAAEAEAAAEVKAALAAGQLAAADSAGGDVVDGGFSLVAGQLTVGQIDEQVGICHTRSWLFDRVTHEGSLVKKPQSYEIVAVQKISVALSDVLIIWN